MLMVHEGRVFIAPEDRFSLQGVFGEDLQLPGSQSLEEWLRWTEEAARKLDARLEAATADGIIGMEAAIIVIQKSFVEQIADMLTGKF